MSPGPGAVLTSLAARESAETTELGARLAFTAAMVGVIAVACWLMWRGWVARGRRQADLPAPAEAPSGLAAPLAGPVEGRYLASTSARDWLDRIVAHGLGATAACDLSVHPEGVRFARQGADDLFVPAAAVRGARLDRGIAGSVYEQGGIVVLTWELGGRLLDSGFRASAASHHDELVAAIAALVPSTAPLDIEEAGT
jgi:hypothetical protein